MLGVLGIQYSQIIRDIPVFWYFQMPFESRFSGQRVCKGASEFLNEWAKQKHVRSQTIIHPILATRITFADLARSSARKFWRSSNVFFPCASKMWGFDRLGARPGILVFPELSPVFTVFWYSQNPVPPSRLTFWSLRL